MDIPNLYLMEIEEIALRHYASGLSNREIYEKGGVPLSGIWVFNADIRRKTGISRLDYPQECRRYIERYEAAIRAAVPLTSEQKRLIQFILARDTGDAIAYRMQKSVTELSHILSDANKQMGIFTEDERARRLQMMAYLAVFERKAALLEIGAKQDSAMRMWTECTPYAKIADELAIAPDLAKTLVLEGAHKLGLNIRGRNTQRNLVHSYFRFVDYWNTQEHAEKPTPVDMSDPAFN